MTPRRQYALAAALLVAGGLLGLVAANAVWGEIPGDLPLPVQRETTTGAEAAPAVRAAAYLALAGTLAVLATRRVGRAVVGALLAGAGVLSVWSSVVWSGPGPTAWWLAGAASGALVAAGGTLVAVRGGRWPVLGARYDRAARPARSPRSTWDALDRGEDPTV